MKVYKLTILLLLILVANPALGARRRSGDYVVKPGDTASAICTRYRLTYTEFARLNPGLDINTIRAGERVRVSGTPDEVSSTRRTESTRSAEPEVSVEPDVVQAEESRDEAEAQDEKPAVATTKRNAASGRAEPADSPAADPKPEAKAEPEADGYLSKYYSTPESPSKKTEPSVAASLLRVVGALVFVVALAVLSLYALKHFSSSKLTRKSPQRSINIIETAGLGPNRALHIVQAGGKFLLVGSTPTQISLVAELNSSDGEETDPATADDFAGILQSASSAEERAEAASRLSDALRDGAAFLQKKSTATRSMRSKAEANEA